MDDRGEETLKILSLRSRIYLFFYREFENYSIKNECRHTVTPVLASAFKDYKSFSEKVGVFRRNLYKFGDIFGDSSETFGDRSGHPHPSNNMAFALPKISHNLVAAALHLELYS